MKIIINAYQYAPVITGTDRMASNFLRELQKIDSVNEYYVVCSSEQYIQSVIKNDNFVVLQPRHLTSNPFIRRVVNKLWRIFLVARLKPIEADVYFSFHNMRLPNSRIAKKMVASNLDLIPLVLDEYKSLVSGQDKEITQTVRVADKFMSISKFSKNELCELLGVNPTKVEVIYLAADNTFSGAASKELPSALPKKFIFTLGGSEPRKNVKTVIDAYVNLPVELKEEFKLVVAGGKWHGQVLDTKGDANIIELGYVPDEQLPALYANAAAFVFASEYEGFGFTLLEAMSCGTPVINARGSSLDEVGGSATLTFEPKDANELAEKITELLGNKELQEKLIQKGYVQSRQFSWEKSTIQLHQILTKI